MTKFTIDPEYLEKYKDADWIETHTGRQFWPACPREGSFTIFDIAHALAQKCRYGGHTKSFYSVAEHCTTLALYARHMGLPVEVQFQFLMHDGNEAYLPDIARPIKHFFPELIVMEKTLDAMIHDWLGLPLEHPEIVKQYDSRIVRDERRQVLFPSGHQWQTDYLDPLGVTLHGYQPREAETRFLQAFQFISREYLGRPTVLAYEPGGFMSFGGFSSRDNPSMIGPDIRMIDLLGKCALAVDPDTGPYYLHGDFDLVLNNV